MPRQRVYRVMNQPADKILNNLHVWHGVLDSLPVAGGKLAFLGCVHALVWDIRALLVLPPGRELTGYGVTDLIRVTNHNRSLIAGSTMQLDGRFIV